MWQFIVGFIVVFGIGLVIRETVKRRNAPPPVEGVPPADSVSGTGAYCTACGTRSFTGDVFCRNCGNKLI